MQDLCGVHILSVILRWVPGMAFFQIKDDPPANQPVVMALAGISSGSPRTRHWFGYVFRGGATTQADYVRLEDVEKSVAYSIAK